MLPPLPGHLHTIPRHSSSPTSTPLTAFEHTPPFQPPATSTLLFLPGLFDGPLTVPYTRVLASRLPPSWRLVEPILSSGYRQWGISGLGDDVREVEDLVRYFAGGAGEWGEGVERGEGEEGKRRGENKVVLMGHSTGCQVIVHYYLSPHSPPTTTTTTTSGQGGVGGGGAGDGARRPKILGGIMQGGVSDREAIAMMMEDEECEEVCQLARQYMEDGRGEDVLPSRYTKELFQSAPVSARRWLSLATQGGEDDYFSSDFGEERLREVFGGLGRVGARVAFLFGGEDQYVVAGVDREGMVKKWEEHVRDNGGTIDEMSGILKGASHNLKEGGAVVKDMVNRVTGFLARS